MCETEEARELRDDVRSGTICSLTSAKTEAARTWKSALGEYDFKNLDSLANYETDVGFSELPTMMAQLTSSYEVASETLVGFCPVGFCPDTVVFSRNARL